MNSKVIAFHRDASAPVQVPRQPKHIFTAHIDIVHGCQLQCLGCPNSVLLPKVKRIEVEDFNRILGNIDVERIHTLRLYNFGEPLLHKDLTGIVSQIPKQKWKASVVEISTNAQRVDWKDFESMLKLEVVNKLVVSCDGDGTPAEYERLRPPSKWEKLIEFLERARVLRDKWSPATQLWTRSVIRTQKDAQAWQDILIPRGWTPEFRRWMALPESKENLTGREIKPPNHSCVFLAQPEEFYAHPWHGEINLLYVDQDGTVVPCCMHPQAGVLGNLKTHKFSEILFGAGRRNLKDLMEKDRASMPVCGECDVGPVGHEGPSYWSQLTYWSPNKSPLPQE